LPEDIFNSFDMQQLLPTGQIAHDRHVIDKIPPACIFHEPDILILILADGVTKIMEMST
jgi:hypothetical protein